jgi:hypothetical protein
MTDPADEPGRMHDAIEAWFTDGDDLDPFADALAEEFRIVSPDGTTRDREAIVGSMREAAGVHAGADPPFVVEVRDVEHRESVADRHLVTYEEHQRIDGAWEARTSSVWLREDDEAPGGLAWVHLHETWLE